jgi:arabinose-5-phosphate isomerase
LSASAKFPYIQANGIVKLTIPITTLSTILLNQVMNTSPYFYTMSHHVSAQRVLQFESEQILKAANRLGKQFNDAVETILHHPGNTIVCGIGKSGAVAQKFTATLCSTGTKAVFLHAAEAVHGDLGIYTPGDPVILISKSGATPEMVRLLPWFKDQGSKVIAILGNLNSPLADQSNYLLDASVDKEADPLNLAPTASTTVSMAICDALAVALMEARQFTAADFARNHPGGQLGRNLFLTVKDVMHHANQIAQLAPHATLRDLVIALTTYNLGAACIVEDGHLLGLVTDGDIRRALLKNQQIDGLKVTEMMTRNPISIASDATLREAVDLMENRSSQISVLPVVDHGVLSGLVRIHDIYHL